MLSSPARIGPKELCRRRRLIISAKWQTVAFNSVCSKKYVTNSSWLWNVNWYTSDKSLLNVAFRLKRWCIGTAESTDTMNIPYQTSKKKSLRAQWQWKSLTNAPLTRQWSTKEVWFKGWSSIAYITDENRS